MKKRNTENLPWGMNSNETQPYKFMEFKHLELLQEKGVYNSLNYILSR